MKKLNSWLVGALAAACLTGSAEADVMVLSTRGGVTGGRPLKTGMVVKTGASITLKAGDQATLLVMGKGLRQVVAGPAEVKVLTDAIDAGGKASIKASQVVLASDGDNTKRMGGVAVRHAHNPEYFSNRPNSPYSNFKFVPHYTAGRLDKVSVSFTGPQPTTLDKVGIESLFPPEDMSGSMGEVKAVKPTQQGQTWRYQVDLPLEYPSQGSASLVLYQGPDKFEVRTVLYPSEADYRAAQENLERDLAAAQRWAQEGGGAEAYVVMMSLYACEGQVEAALHSAQEALKLTPHDPGLLESAADLCFELGHTKQGKAYLEAAKE